MKNNIPYFYIIRHIFSGKMYAGSRWAKNCNPNELLSIGGYYTNSKPIRKLFLEEKDSFEILRIDTNCDNLHPYIYETLFLQTLNCSKSAEWFNLHNNELSTSDFEDKKSWLKKIDNSNYLKSDEHRQKISKIQLKLCEEGSHNFVNVEYKKKHNKENARRRIENGTHPFQNSEIQSNIQKRRVANGTHHLLSGEIQRNTQNKLASEGNIHFKIVKYNLNKQEMD